MSQSGSSLACSRTNVVIKFSNCFFSERVLKVTAISQSGCRAWRYATLRANTTVLPVPANPRMRCTPSNVSTTAALCWVSRFAMESSNAFIFEPRDPSSCNCRFLRFLRSVEIDWITESKDGNTSAGDAGKLWTKPRTVSEPQSGCSLSACMSSCGTAGANVTVLIGAINRRLLISD